MNHKDFIEKYEAALATQNWQNVEPLIHVNACVTFSNGRILRGINEIEEAYKQNFALIKNEHFTISQVHWQEINEQQAIYTFQFKWSGMINNQAASGSGNGITTIVFEHGTWKLIEEVLST